MTDYKRSISNRALVFGVLLSGVNFVWGAEEAIRIEDLDAIPRDQWPDLSKLEFKVAPLTNYPVDGLRDSYEDQYFESFQVPKDNPLWSPFIVNGETYADFENKKVARSLERTQTELSNDCKRCIDESNQWCPTGNYSSGYCCDGEDIVSCPRQGVCSNDFSIKELQYMTCPNELGCTFSRFLMPKTNGEQELYEMFEGTFVQGDLCNFKITNPSITDLNDVMYLRLEYFARCSPILIKGESLQNPIAMYSLSKGQDYTALRGINFYLLFVSTEESSGDFVFRIWFNRVGGYGEVEPDVVTYEKNPLKPEDFGTGTEPEMVTDPNAGDNSNENNDGGEEVVETNLDDVISEPEVIGGDTGGINEIEEEEVVPTPAKPVEKEVVGEEETPTDEKTDEEKKDPVVLPEDPTDDDLSYLDNVVIDITDPTVETDSNTSGFSEEYKESLRKQGFTEDQISRLESAATTDAKDAVDTSKLSSNDGKVTVEDPNGGLSTGILALICVLAFLIIVPCMIWIIVNIIAKVCPQSKCGKRFNEWKANRALTDDQKQLRAFRHNKLGFVNATNASDDGSGDVIMQSGSKRSTPQDSQQRVNTQGNRIYPLTDVDDANASVANVGPGGLTSADEYSAEGLEKKPKNNAQKTRINIIGYDANANPIIAPAPNNASLRTIDIDTNDQQAQSKRGGLSGYNFARTSQGFNTQGTGSGSVAMPSLGFGEQTQDTSGIQNMQMQQMKQMQDMTNMMSSQGSMTPEQMAFMMQQQQMMMTMMMQQQQQQLNQNSTMAGDQSTVSGRINQSGAMSPMSQVVGNSSHARNQGLASLKNSQAAQSQPDQGLDGLETIDRSEIRVKEQTRAVPTTNTFNPPNPYATGMNFNQTGMNQANQSIQNHNNRNSLGEQPTIGASLMDQEAVTLNSNLMGKKKKVKKVKKARFNPNALLDDSDDYSQAFANDNSINQGRRPMNSSLLNAGASIGQSNLGGRPQNKPNQPQDNLDALPDLDLDGDSQVMNGSIGGADWDYKESDKAKVESVGVTSVVPPEPQRKPFDINALRADIDDDDIL